MAYEPSPKTAAPADTAVRCASRKSLRTRGVTVRLDAWRSLFGWRGLMDCRGGAAPFVPRTCLGSEESILARIETWRGSNTFA